MVDYIQNHVDHLSSPDCGRTEMTFEEWQGKHGPSGGAYDIEMQRAGWDAALEEAAKRFEEAAKSLNDNDPDKDTALWAASEVRSLKCLTHPDQANGVAAQLGNNNAGCGCTSPGNDCHLGDGCRVTRRFD